MPWQTRIVVPGPPYHITQRDNRWRQSFFGPADYQRYLQIATEEFAASEVEVWAYCLLPNHVHLIATPSRTASLATAVGATHLRCTRPVNHPKRWTDYLW